MAKLDLLLLFCSLLIVGGETQNSTEEDGKKITLTSATEYSCRLKRPCPVYDTTCIRKFLASHSKCKIAKRTVPKRYFRTQNNFYYPNFNISASQLGVYYSGGSGNVEEFVVDKENNQLLLQIRFKDAAINSTLDVYRFLRDGKEPAVTRSDSYAVFPNFTTTTIFRNLTHLDLANSETFAFVDALPTPLLLNPSAGEHPDPAVAVMFAQFIANPTVVVQEAFLTGASFVAGNYIQYTLCDFGLDIL